MEADPISGQLLAVLSAAPLSIPSLEREVRSWSDGIEAGFNPAPAAASSAQAQDQEKAKPPMPKPEPRWSQVGDEDDAEAATEPKPKPKPRKEMGDAASRPPASAVRASIRAAAESLAEQLVEAVRACPPSALAARPSGGSYRKGGSQSRTDQDAALYRPGDTAEDLAANLLASQAADLVACGGDGDGDGDGVEEGIALTSELLRAAKNLIRHRNQTKAATEAALKVAEGDDTADGDPLSRLRSQGMLRLYVAILVGCAGIERTGACARNASLSLFHAAYGAPGHDAMADRTRAVLVDEDEVDFVPVLMGLLLPTELSSSLPPPLLLSLVRSCHFLLGCNPVIVGKMNKSIAVIAAERPPEVAPRLFPGGPVTLVSVLVGLLRSALAETSDPPFPGTEPTDRRPELVAEIMRVLFALRANMAVPYTDSDGHSCARQLGETLCRILTISQDPGGRSRGSRLAAVNLLMDFPVGYGRYLREKEAIPSLLSVLEAQADEVIEGPSRKRFDASKAALVPILAVLDRVAAEDAEARVLIKAGIFPQEEEDAYQAKAREVLAKGGGNSNGLRTKNMKPAIAMPRGTLRHKILRLMTWPESSCKRCASELLWRLCDGDASEFILRTGFGNAVHMLGIKGLVNIPEESGGVYR